MRVFVTVGSTRFDDLVDTVLSSPVLESFKKQGFETIIIQCGQYEGGQVDTTAHRDDTWSLERDGLMVQMWRYKQSLSEEFEVADLVLSHAGSGTILDVLRLGKPLIVVPNPSLLDNHQVELAEALEKLGYLHSSTTRDLHHCISTFSPSQLKRFPQRQPEKFREILDTEMGF